MATPLNVPRQYEEGIAKIRDLGSESVRELVSALLRIPPTFNEDRLSSAVARMVDTIAATDVEDIVPALLSLYSYQDYSRLEVSDIVEGVAQTMVERGSGSLALDEEKRGSFEEHLTQLLSLDPLRLTVRAGRLSLENEHTLQDVRILTDVRAAFDPDDPKAPPLGAVILHTLKISYRGDNTYKDFFVALDADGVNRLLGELERANDKAESLKSVLSAAELPYIDAE